METELQNFGFFSVPMAAAEQTLEHHSKQLVFQNPVSRVDHHDVDDDALSDCESGVSGSRCIISKQESRDFCDGLIRIEEEDSLHQSIKMKFLDGLKNSLGVHTQVQAIYRDDYSSFKKQAKLQCFSVFAKAMDQICGGNTCFLKYAWYGASKDEISKIMSHGFGDDSLSDGIYGRGVYLSPLEYPLDSLQSCVSGEDGIRYMLLCRVIMGRTELVWPGSGQRHPSCEDYDSGVDNLESPRKYIVWATHMNTHILPEFVISFKPPTTSSEGCQRISVPLRKPISPWMSFPTLISELSNVLPADSVKQIKKHHNDHRERRITRHELIQKVRQIAGDRLLLVVIKSYRQKSFGASSQ